MAARHFHCSYCGFDYHEDAGLPEEGVEPGTAWEDLPDDWYCPNCGTEKSDFEEVAD